MKTITDLFPPGDDTNEARQAIETLIDQTLEIAAKRFVEAGSEFSKIDAKIEVNVVQTLGGIQLHLIQWKQVAAKYRAAGWSVTFAKNQNGRAVLLLAP